MSRDIVHAQRGFRRRFCGDFVNRFTESEALPMDWEEDMQLPTGNEILPGGQDEIGTLCRRNPLLRSGRGRSNYRITKYELRSKGSSCAA